MILIIGGAFQGKQEYARKLWQEKGKKGTVLPELLPVIREMAEHGASREDAGAWAGQLAKEHSGDILILEEVGYGIVPMEAKDRLFREMVGTVGQVLAANADEVYRVSCGLGMKLKAGKETEGKQE